MEMHPFSCGRVSPVRRTARDDEPRIPHSPDNIAVLYPQPHGKKNIFQMSVGEFITGSFRIEVGEHANMLSVSARVILDINNNSPRCDNGRSFLSDIIKSVMCA